MQGSQEKEQGGERQPRGSCRPQAALCARVCSVGRCGADRRAVSRASTGCGGQRDGRGGREAFLRGRVRGRGPSWHWENHGRPGRGLQPPPRHRSPWQNLPSEPPALALEQHPQAPGPRLHLPPHLPGFPAFVGGAVSSPGHPRTLQTDSTWTRPDLAGTWATPHEEATPASGRFRSSPSRTNPEILGWEGRIGAQLRVWDGGTCLTGLGGPGLPLISLTTQPTSRAGRSSRSLGVTCGDPAPGPLQAQSPFPSLRLASWLLCDPVKGWTGIGSLHG